MWNWIINKLFETSGSLEQSQEKEESFPAADTSEGPEAINSSKAEISSNEMRITDMKTKTYEIEPLDFSKITLPPIKIDFEALEREQREMSKLLARNSGATISIMSCEPKLNIVQETYNETKSSFSNSSSPEFTKEEFYKKDQRALEMKEKEGHALPELKPADELTNTTVEGQCKPEGKIICFYRK